MADFSTIGILGGMGPEATNRLCALITESTPVTRDQEHIPVITYNNPQIPDRVRAVRGAGESPVPEMVRTAQVLERAGAQMLLMPCNLAHFYLSDVQRSIRIPLLNMVEETVRFTIETHPLCRKVGIIASTPTIECGIYEKAFARQQRQLVAPASVEQEAKVMRAIYGADGIKCGHKTGPLLLLREVANNLVAMGAEVIIAGCTEVSLVLTEKDAPCAVIDPLKILARVAVNRAMSGEAGRAAATIPAGRHLRTGQNHSPKEAPHEQHFDDDGGRARVNQGRLLRGEI